MTPEVSPSLTRPRSGSPALPVPEPGRWAAEGFVAEHLAHLVERRHGDESPSSPRFRGGQQAADLALAAAAKRGLARYEARRDDAYPQPRRRVSQLSPWIRHGLLPLQTVWDALLPADDSPVPASDSPADDSPIPAPDSPDDADRELFREALLWQEYARHVYARLGSTTAALLRSGSGPPPNPVPEGDRGRGGEAARPRWDRALGCVELTLDELEEDGWLVGSTRQWLASHWAVRHGHPADAGEDHFFQHLLDGSRAANRLGWLLASGAGPEPSAGFSRWSVEERAPGLCASCELVRSCPIEDWAPTRAPRHFDHHPLLDHDPDLARTAGPTTAQIKGQPEAVWLTAESLGESDPALRAHPDLPAVFVFDEPLLARLRLSSKRLVFLVETLAELATRHQVELLLGDPVDLLAGRPLAGTFTPVPGWRRRSAQLELVAIHPWPWLRSPHHSSIGSFAAWQGSLT